MIFKKNYLFLIFALFSGCCISMPHQEQIRDLGGPVSLEISKDQNLGTSYFAIGDWPKECWWEVFHSEELNNLIGEALLLNPTLEEAQKRVESAWQIAKVVRSKLFPYIFFSASDDFQHLSKNGLYRALNPKIPLNANLIDVDIKLNYEFDFWCKNRNLFLAALSEEMVAQAEAYQARLVITTSIAEAFFALKTNLIKKNLYQELVVLWEKTFDLQNLLKSNALVSKIPLLITEEKLLEAEKQLIEIDKEILLNRHLINILAGFSPDEPFCIDENLPSLPEKISVPCDLSLNLLARRPDLMAQIWHVKSLAFEVGAAMADFYPDVNLSAFVGLETVHAARLFEISSGTFGFKPALNLPLFTAGAISANIRARKAQFEQAVFRYNEMLLASAQEVADLLEIARSIFEQKKEQEFIVESAQELTHLTSLIQQTGLDNVLRVYNTQEVLIQKKLVDTELLFGQYTATIGLIRSLGGGFFADCIPLEAQEACL